MIRSAPLILFFKAPLKNCPDLTYSLTQDRRGWSTHRYRRLVSMVPEGETGGGNTSHASAGSHPHDPIRAPDGSLNFGAMTPDIAQAAKQPLTVAPIRLFVGHHQGPHRGFGVAHIQAEHGEEIARIGLSIPAFVQDALAHDQQIWKQPNGRMALVRTGKRGRVSVIELQRNGGVYSVVTAYPRIPEIRLEGTLIWTGRTVSNTRKGMDAHERKAQPPDPDFQRVGSPEPLAGRFPEGTPKPVLEGLGNQINDSINVSRSDLKHKLTKSWPLTNGARILFFISPT